MTLGEKIAKLRGSHHLSQGDLAEKMGVSRQSVSKWETGSSVPDLDKLVALCALFDITLDALVREADPPEEAAPPPATAAAPIAQTPSAEPYPARKIAGWILAGVGLLSIVLGLALNLVLTFLGGYLLLCGVLCLTVKKHPALVIGWGTFLTCTFFLPWVTSIRLHMIFSPGSYHDGLTIQLLIAYAFWAVLLLLVWMTLKKTRAGRHPILFCGWAVFSQLYTRIPIVFYSTGETPFFYRALSWGTILFLLILVFFTAKLLIKPRPSV